MNQSFHSKIAKEKLMILYIIKKSNSTLTYNQLSNLILEYNLLNYFDFVEYFNELNSSNFIEKWKGPEIKLSDFSMQVMELLEGSIDSDVRMQIDNIFSSENSSRSHSEFQIIPLEDGKCIVKLSLRGEIDEHFSLSFTVDSVDDAKNIENSWVNKNKSLYREMLKIIKEA